MYVPPLSLSQDYFKSDTTGVPSSLKLAHVPITPVSITTAPPAPVLPVIAPPPKYLSPEPETVIVIMKTDEMD